jgi:UDP-glucose:(heptosyl)LPS alpha-1,3-glucosyltransferase
MKLAFVKKRFSLHGGAEQYLRTMLVRLQKDGHDLHVFANRWTGEPGFSFHKIGIIPATSFASLVSFSKNAAKSLYNAKFDCIISFERTEYQDIYRAGDGCHRAWLEIRQQLEPVYKKISFGLNPFHLYTLSLEKRIFGSTPLIVVNSGMVKKQIQHHYGTSENKLVIAYNGVDLSTFSPENRDKWRSEVRSSFGIGQHEKVILFVGSGFKRKGLGTLLSALPEIRRELQGEKFMALIVGKGDSGEYMKYAEQMGISENMKFAGPQSEIQRLYAAADIFVLPTIYDPFSNATLEAMASGLPVITTKNNGAAEIIDHGKDGFVTDSITDPDELARNIILAFANAPDVAMRARAKAEQFSIEDAARVFVDLIKRFKGE